MLNIGLVSLALAVAAVLAFTKRLATSSAWRATVIPLASIMGSGFLVSAPLLAGAVGSWALVCMAALLAIAYAVGAAIRFNIRHFEPIEDQQGGAQAVALLSRFVLAGAYFVSVTYYLQLLGAFVLNAFGVDDGLLGNVIASALILAIGGIGMGWGLGLLEGLEKYAVSLNLGMITALLAALAWHNAALWIDGSWQLPTVSSEIDFGDVRILLGLLIVVQGFETSRYLGDEHEAGERIRTMRIAQWLSAAIYVVFIGLATVLFQEGLGADVTAIIAMTAPVAAILPVLLSVAAVGSQFSAAVADTSGAGGLVEELSRRRLSLRAAYVLIMGCSLALTWATDVQEIIAYASRAFALYYMLQCLVAAMVARSVDRSKSGFFATLSLVCLAVFVLGSPSE